MAKGTVHVLIPLALIVAFICAFFAFFTYDQLLVKSVECLRNLAGKLECKVADVGPNFIIGVIVIGFLVALMFGVLYIVAKVLTSPETLAGQGPAYNPQGSFNASR